MIRNTDSFIFEKDDESSSFEIGSIKHLDLDKLAMACRIDTPTYKDGKGRYLSLIIKRQADISDYFMNWIHATNEENNKTYSLEFYQLINLVSPPIIDGKQLSMDEFKEQIHSYISTSKKNINIFEISDHFFQDPEYLFTIAEINNLHFDTEFKFDSSILMKFIKIRLSSDNIRLDFPSDFITQNRVFVNENRIIIESESLVRQFHEVTGE